MIQYDQLKFIKIGLLMSWLDGLQKFGNTISAYGYNSDVEFQGNKSTKRVRTFTHVLNVLGYVLGPIIGIIRLIAAAVIACQASNYKTFFGDGGYSFDHIDAQKHAQDFAKQMAFRGLIELTWIGGLLINPIIDAKNT